MYNRSFLLRLKNFLELFSAQFSNWAKVKPNTSLSIDFFISSAPELNRKTVFVGFVKRASTRFARSPDIEQQALVQQPCRRAIHQLGKHERRILRASFQRSRNSICAVTHSAIPRRSRKMRIGSYAVESLNNHQLKLVVYGLKVRIRVG